MSVKMILTGVEKNNLLKTKTLLFNERCSVMKEIVMKSDPDNRKINCT